MCANGSIITDGDGILDVRFGDETSEVHPCKGLFNTCCTLKSETPITPPIEKKEGCGHRNYQGVGFRVTDRDNEAQFGMSKMITNPLYFTSITCLSFLFINLAEFPWMVAIIKEEQSLQETLNVYQCGGSLIHPSVKKIFFFFFFTNNF